MLASVYLSRSMKTPEKRREHYFSFLFQSQKKRLVKLLVVNQWLMWCWQSDCIDCNRPWFLTKRVINCQSSSVRERKCSHDSTVEVLMKRKVFLKDRLELSTEGTVVVQVFLGMELPCWGQLTLKVLCKLLKAKIKAKAFQHGSFSLFSLKITEKKAVCPRQHIHSFQLH